MNEKCNNGIIAKFSYLVRQILKRAVQRQTHLDIIHLYIHRARLAQSVTLTVASKRK